jgi:hypothetical protein
VPAVVLAAVDMANPDFQWSAHTAHAVVVVAVLLVFLDPCKILLVDLAHGEAKISEELLVPGRRIRLVAETVMADQPL